MSFNKYPVLPKELRLQIIEEAIEPVAQQRSHHGKDICLSRLASVDLEWNQLIEQKLFKTIRLYPGELDDFSKICSKRYTVLRSVRLMLSTFDPVHTNHQWEGVLVQLFNIMKDWVPDAERGQQGLINLELDFSVTPWDTIPPISWDIGNFPEVQIIGAFSEYLQSGFCFQLHHPILNTLHAKLPNLYGARLPLQLEPPLQSAVEVAISAVDTLFAIKPNLTSLEVVADADRRPLERSNWVTVTASLTPLISRWHESLVCLALTHPMHIAHFLLKAGNVAWPKLKEMTLSGLLDGPQIGTSEILATINHSCNDILIGLVTALPRMPAARTIRICLRTAEIGNSGFKLGIDLGRSSSPSRHIAGASFWDAELNKDPLMVCSGTLMPASASAVALVEATGSHEEPIELSRSAVTELQDTVRGYRQMELAVFNCTGKDHSTQPWWRDNDTPCTQWNAQTGTWDPAFWNDMDLFVYQMGKYWEWKIIQDEWGF